MKFTICQPLLVAVFSLWASTYSSASIFGSAANDRPLPPEQAYEFSSSEIAPGRYRAEFVIKPNYYLYQNKLAAIAAEGLGVGEVVLLGLTETHEDPFFGKQQVYYQYAGLEFSVYDAGSSSGELSLEYQGCWEGGVCYPVNEHILPVRASSGLSQPAPASEFDFTSSQAFSELLASGSLAWIVALFFFAGLLLAFTPCVLPMVPIVSAMIVGQQNANLRRRLLLTSVYVLSMALVFAGLGAVSGLIGISLQNYLQHPVLIVLFTLLLLYFAGSMFGWYQMSMPAAWQSWADSKLNKNQQGGWVYASGLGVVSALLVSPCVSAPLAGALLFIARTSDPYLGALALFSLGLGMGAPLMLIGAGFTSLIPKSGNWMLTVKAAFGVMLVLLAVYMLDRLIADSLSLLLYGAVLIVSAVYMWRAQQRFIQSLGVLLFIYGLIYSVGAMLGGGNPLRPLEKLPALTSTSATAVATNPTTDIDYWTVVYTPEQLQQSLGQLQADAQPILYFTAEWCVACKELQWFTFSDSQVQQKLSEFVLIKIDVTDNTAETRELLRQHQAFGPPALIFLDSQRQPQSQHSIMTFLQPDAMLEALARAKNI